MKLLKQTQDKPIETIEDAYREYIKHFPKKATSLKTTIFRFLVPYKEFKLHYDPLHGGQIRGAMIKEIWNLANQIKLTDLWEIEKVLTWQSELFDSLNVSIHTRKPNKHYLKHFLEWCRDQGILGSPVQEKWAIPQSLPGVSKAFHRCGGREQNRIVNREPIIHYAANLSLLSTEFKQGLDQLSAFWSDQNYEGTRSISKTIEESTIKDQIERLSYLIGWLALDKLDYHQQMCQRAKQRQETRENYESFWLSVNPSPPNWLLEMQKKYPPRPLETLELEDLIPFVETRSSQLEKLISEQEIAIEQGDCSKKILDKIQAELKAQNAILSFDVIVELGQSLYKNQAFAEEVKKLNRIADISRVKEEAEEQMEQASKKVRALLKNFFKWLQYQHNPNIDPNGYHISPHYRANFCDSLLSLAKFRYQEVTNSRKYPDYTDIDIVVEVRTVRQEEINFESKPNPVSSIKRNPTWNELGNLLKELLVACAPRRKINSKPDFTTMGPLRSQTAVAKDLQKYLVMMFFRLVSPERQHVLRELQQHNSLKLCWINWEAREYEEAPWDQKVKRYKVHYNLHTKLYYLDADDVKDSKGIVVKNPQGKAFAWVVFLDSSQTKIDQDNAYRIPKIYNPELDAWLHGREDFSEVWFNWPIVHENHNNKWSKRQYYWCGYVDLDNDRRLGFRETFAPSHNFVFTQPNGKPFSTSNMCRFYDAIVWRYLGVRSNPHEIRSSSIGYFKLKGMTDAENESLAKLKSHSVKMQDSPIYNKLSSLEKTARASEMIISDFLQEHGLNQVEYGLV